ncbi:unnamed protein product [Calicophoron daubneyi]|uniref:Uncharacterized protein n=1 Tax=Calicophoron daubneyi TaxID=300641 RepID=A0AAV2SZB7_CALDB
MVEKPPCICVVLMSLLTLSASMTIWVEKNTGVEEDLSEWLGQQLTNRELNEGLDNLVTCDSEDYMCRLEKLERRLQRNENLLLELQNRISYWIAQQKEKVGSDTTSKDSNALRRQKESSGATSKEPNILLM